MLQCREFTAVLLQYKLLMNFLEFYLCLMFSYWAKIGISARVNASRNTRTSLGPKIFELRYSIDLLVLSKYIKFEKMSQALEYKFVNNIQEFFQYHWGIGYGESSSRLFWLRCPKDIKAQMLEYYLQLQILIKFEIQALF